MNPSAAIAHWHGVWEDARADLPSTPWLGTRRDDAFGRFHAAGFPTRRDEDWRYTDLSLVFRGDFRPAPALGGGAAAQVAALLAELPQVDAAARLVFANGHPLPSLSDARRLPEGLEVSTFREALEKGDPALETRLASLADGESRPFEALNTALFTDGALIRVRAGVDLDRPIQIVFATVGDEAPSFASPRLLVLMDEGSRASLIQTWTGSDDGPWLDNAVSEIWLGRNARLDRLEVQREPSDAVHVSSLHVRQDADSRFTSTCLSLGARLSRNEVRVRLDAPGAECRLDGLSLVADEQHVDHQVLVDHAQPHGTSNQLYKGILDDRATAAFAGGVLVQPHAQKTDAKQANHNLLLSPGAQADSKPQLEIFADDVKCAHGATVGQLDEEAIFYFQSRGIDPRTARNMLLRAFAAEVPSRIEDESLRAHAEAILEATYPGAAL